MNAEDKLERSQALRAAAETYLTNSAPSSRAVDKLLHELEVNQIELEMQNEALRFAQDALQDSMLRYQDLYELAPVGYFTISSDDRIANLNMTAVELLRGEREALIDQHFTSLVMPDDQARWRAISAQWQTLQGTGVIELRLRRFDGEIFYGELNCSRTQVGAGGTAIRMALTNVSAKHKAQEERDHAVRRIEALMQYASDCIVVVDESNTIIASSESCKQVYGYMPSELIGMPGQKLRLDWIESCPPHLPKALDHYEALTYQTLGRHRNGTEFPVQVGGTQILIDGKRYFQAIVRDMSEPVRQRLAMEEKLADKTARLSTLSRHLVEAQEDARRRLSRELHDHTSPNLAAININLGLIDKALTTLGAARLKEQIADTIALVEDTNSSIREISADLRSPVLDHAGLCAAMEAYGNHYQRRTGIEVNVTCPSQVKRLDPTLESMLFRVFQEALTNTLKHANATAVTVSMLHENEAVELIIADDGDGFSMANPAPAVGAEATGDVGMGMITMLETIELIGGSLRIDSVHGAGVHIVVRVPL